MRTGFTFRLQKKHWLSVLLLFLPYSTILIFPAFGPILNLCVAPDTARLMSSWFLVFLITGFCFSPIKSFSNKTKNLLLSVFTLFTALFTSFFLTVPYNAKWIILACFGICTGRIGLHWSRHFISSIPGSERGRIIGLSLVGCYGILYIMNVAIPSLSPEPALMIVSFILTTTGILYMIFGRAVIFIEPEQPEPEEIKVKKDRQWLWPIPVIFLIFITAGITYTGIYRLISENYATIDRYYNVLPFVLVVPLAGILSDRFGRQILIYVGIASLGISFISYQFLPGTGVYFLLQTFLQIGWAFMDAFAWLIGADIGSLYGKKNYQAYTVSAFLSGTFCGSILFSIFESSIYDSSGFLAITHLPLFASLLFIGKFNLKQGETIEQNNRSDRNKAYSENLMLLTVREREIFFLLAKGKSRKQIVSGIHITENTLKTHSRNIYKKLKVKNRHELINRYEHINGYNNIKDQNSG